jgi:hypothetical protein
MRKILPNALIFGSHNGSYSLKARDKLKGGHVGENLKIDHALGPGVLTFLAASTLAASILLDTSTATFW